VKPRRVSNPGSSIVETRLMMSMKEKKQLLPAMTTGVVRKWS
jgi:hypothetical protein